MEYIFIIIVFLFSAIIHEIAHGYMALKEGDTTAKNAGRLTLNPINHLDPIGSVFLPLILFLTTRLSGGGVIFGWAKPVPINPYFFKDKKYGELKVAFAGPASNLLIALFFGLILRFIPGLGTFGLLLAYVVWINIQLAVFNLIPIPPLDGSHILFAFFKNRNIEMFLRQYGFILLLLIVFFLFNIVIYIVSWIFYLFTGSFFF